MSLAREISEKDLEQPSQDPLELFHQGIKADEKREKYSKTFNKKTGKLSALLAVLLLAVIIPSMPLANADDTICSVSISGTHDNVVVPSGSSCNITPGTIVNGNVKVESGGALSSFGSQGSSKSP